ncbi:MAG TPA: hypothetical protein VLR49_01970 [Ferruginibacter sp.]|nr:hypothetical protein [Ferruginibacter sp.]
MNFTGYKVGFWPYGLGLDKAGDRRRFVFYAREKGLKFEIARKDKHYDIIYLSMGCNISDWLKYKGKFPETKIIFEVIDSYFLQQPSLVTRLKGLVRFVTKKESKLYFNYQSAILDLIKIADAVVCSSATQKNFILQYNKNVHISLDYFLDDITYTKKTLPGSGKLKLVWEGQAYTVHNLLNIKDVFKQLADKVELHVITDPVVVFPFKIFNKKTSSILSQIECDQYFYEWRKETFSKIITEADLAIIPIGQEDELHWNKPENKLLLFWQIGIPVLTSPTPAYTNVMKTAGLSCLCNGTEDWVEKINNYIKMNDDQRKEWVEKADIYLKNNHTKNMILKNWDEIFLSLNV